MAASQSANGLLNAISAYRGEHGNSPGHEDILRTLARVEADVHRGTGTPTDGPARAEGYGGSFQRTQPAEVAHDTGGGNVRSNAPGGFPGHADVPAIFAGSGNDLSGTVNASGGNHRSNLPGDAGRGDHEARRIAAQREASRPDSKMHPNHDAGGGNARSNEPSSAERGGGHVTVPPARPTGSLAHDEGVGRNADRQPEPAPPRGGQDTISDGFRRAAQQARERLQKSR